jgi:hypothetical protein
MSLRRWIAAAALAAPAVLAAETAVIPPGGYPAAATAEIDDATTSIRLYLYLFNYQPSNPEPGPAKLADALIRAKERGVDVRVVLDKSLSSPDPVFADAKNDAAGSYLAGAGVDVYVSSGDAPLHAKILIADGSTTLVGSTNWSSAAFNHNREADVLIRSTEVARTFLDSFEGLPEVPWVLASMSTAAVPLSFVDSPGKFGAMSHGGDVNAFDTYLYFLWKGAAPGRPTTVDEASWRHTMGWDALPPNDVRMNVQRTLARLRGRYGLLTFEKTPGSNLVVTLSSAPSGGSVGLPTTYFGFGWDKRLSFAAKAFLLLSLRHSADSPTSPRWAHNEATLDRLHGTTSGFLQSGIQELRRADLLQVLYGPEPPGGAGPRETSVYTPMPLYDPAKLEARMRALGEKYGADALARARALAALVYDDSEAEAIRVILDLMPRLPPGALEHAEEVIRAKNANNPHRSMGYLIGILRSEARR